MNKFAIMAAVAAAALMTAPTAAHAQEWYAGAGYTNFDFDAGNADAITGRLGYKFNRNFAVEGEGSFGVNDDEVDLNHNLGAYAVGILPVSDSFDVHARVGYQTSEVDTPMGSADDDGLGYGVGATWHFTPSFGLRADWTRMDGDGGNDDAVSLGGVVSF